MAKMLIANIKGPKGDQGPQGPQGPKGDTGNDGLPSNLTVIGTTTGPAAPGAGDDAYIADKVRTFGTQTRTELNAAFARPSASPALAALRRDLDNGRSTAFGVFSDSTGDADGSVAANDRWVSRFARNLGAKYPNYHVILKKWDGAAQDYGPWVEIQSQAAGRRYINLNGRSLRWETPDSDFASGNMDIRALIAPDTWAPTANGAIAARVTDETSPWGTQFQFRFYLTTTGALQIIWSDDGAAWNHVRTSTANIAAANGTPLWVRTTVEVVTGTSETIKFYTSNDGVAWTQLGTTVTVSGASSKSPKPSTAFIEVGGYAWQPLSDPLNGKVYEVQIRDGVGGKTLTSCNPADWRRYGDPSTTIGGAPTLYVINGAASGQNLAYFSDATRMPKMAQDYGQRVQFYSTSHNETDLTGPRVWTNPYKAWVDATLARLPKASAVAVGQNPHTAAWGTNEQNWGENHKTRIAELSVTAGKNLWGYLDAYRAFLDKDPTLATLVSSDGLHPLLAGYQVWADEAMRLTGFPA